jgi:hypothetical protein
MLFNRVRPKNTRGTIYHYCSPETFLTILEKKTIRFSDINLLNDAEEGRYGYNVFEEAADRLIKHKDLPDTVPKIPLEFMEQVDRRWSPMSLYLSSFVACFSKDGDSLSQWRAYAGDGQGFAIGFDARELRRLPIQILNVLYDRKKQVREMIIALGGLYLEFLDRGDGYDQPWFGQRCHLIAASSIALKNPAWRDEKEVRCQHVVDVLISEQEWLLKDEGGESDGANVEGQPVNFQVRGGSITPYIDMPFEVSESHKPIREVVLGPRCKNAYGNVLFALGNLGFGVVPLRSAGAAYR